ncbi:hypothetical protein [Bowmanella denitrificans]|uniref:hypothetical protein n=1 Tax=Bowmanella denitrificans TaxID=366582 RepID=UPI000C9B594C|nr:hypothetical protein [Bowmanella denitrificans]
MTSTKNELSTKLAKELHNNPRLQWLLLAVAVIIALSLIKSMVDSLAEQRGQIQGQLNLLARLQHSASSETDPEQSQRLAARLSELHDRLPVAPSASVAEAKALAEVESSIGSMLGRKRLSLIGSEPLTVGQQTYWSVRVDIAGQLPGPDYIRLLSMFDNTSGYRRIASLQYSPKTSDSLSLVVDLLYRQAGNE